MGIGADRYLWDNHGQDILDDLPKIHAHSGPWDLIFFTGDLTQRGSPEEFELFDKRLGELLNAVRGLQGHDPLLLPVPGNHDLARPKAQSGAVALAKTLASDGDGRRVFWSDADSELRNEVRKSFEGWTAWWSKWAERLSRYDYRPGMLPGEYSVSLDMHGLRIGVLGLNSAALHLYDVKPGALSLDARQVTEACGEGSKPWTRKHDICFLLTHHPPDWLDEAGKRALDEDIYPPGTFGLHLFGHAHEGALQTSTVGAGLERVRLLGRSLFGLEWVVQRQERLMGYLVGKCWLDERERRLRLWPRSAVRTASGGGWQVVSDSNTYQLPDDNATRIMNLGKTPRQPVPHARADKTEVLPAALCAEPSIAQTIVHPFNPLSGTPFLDLCRSVRGSSSPAALFADRLLIALKSQPEHADLPYLVEAQLRGELDGPAEARLYRIWAEGVTRYAPEASLTSGDDLDPLQRLLAPVAANVAELRRGLRCVITRPLPADVLHGGRLALIREERQKHLRTFRGRESDLAELKARLREGGTSTARVVLVRAPEGFGKSALVSMLVEQLRFGPGGMGHDLTAVRKECDWLPGPLVHFGKAEKHPQTIVRLLLAQANAMLVQPVALPNLDDGYPDFSGDLEMSLGSDSMGTWGREVRARRGQSRTLSWARKDPDPMLRSALNQALARLVEERGSAELMLDALDEISSDGSELNFIPDVLPTNVSMLLATRPEEGILRRLETLRPVSFGLQGVDEATASVLTGLPRGAELTRIVNETQGSPLLMEYVARSVEAGVAPNTIDLTHAARALFSVQVNRWRREGLRRNEDTLYQALILFSIMEGAGTISVDTVQGFVNHLGADLSQAELRDLLEPVSGHVDGLATGQLKLTTRKLAEYVWERELGPRDRRNWITRVVDWLAEDDLVEVPLVMGFLRTWTDPAKGSDPEIIKAAGELIGSLERTQKVKKLYDIFDTWPKSDERPLPDASVACLRAAARAGDGRAMRRLGVRLLDGTGLTRTPEEGEHWLREAAAEDGDAVAELGRRLLNGDGVAQNVEEGERWLRKAADGENSRAMRLLGVHLLFGRHVAQNVEEGERWLRKAADAGEAPAMVTLGRYLLDGDRVAQNVDEGERWLRKAADAGHNWAMQDLGRRLLDGTGVAQNVEEGERWLRKAADEGEPWAMRDLGRRLLDGTGVRPSADEGERWLRKAADAGNSWAMGDLGRRLLDGTGVAQNVDEGERWLRKAADAGNSWAMGDLGRRLLDGTGVAQNVDEGERWLRKAADAENNRAMGDLGARLLNGFGLTQNLEEGERWLRKAADAGHSWAMQDLGGRLLDGTGVAQNLEEGERWLRKAADAAEPSAMRDLGRRLLDGTSVAQNLEEGERWLRKAADAENNWAMVDLGGRLLDGTGVAQNLEEGERWLRKAAGTENNWAMVDLGGRLLDGTGVAQNLEEGERWLRKAADVGEPRAMRTLGRRLLNGDGVAQNVDEGERWLRKAADAGDTSAMHALGYHLYTSALGRVDSDAAFQEAGLLFSLAWKKDHSSAINLAYMLRRGEFVVDGLDVVDVLAQAEAAAGSFALVNLALHILRERSDRDACLRADSLFERAVAANKIDEVVGWWTQSARNGDPEGYVVLALLWRHHRVAAEPDQVAVWWEVAERSGWHVPPELRGQRLSVEEKA